MKQPPSSLAVAVRTGSESIALREWVRNYVARILETEGLRVSPVPPDKEVA